jgi:DNA-binding SARP family transcriptional activator
MRYDILGPLELSENGRHIEVVGAKQRALLAVLLLNANRVVSSERLIDALWEDQVPDTAVKALQVHVSQLRKLLGSTPLATRKPGYVLQVEDGELDLHEFEALVQRARDATAAEASMLLRDALALWRGPPLADFALDRFAQADIARLEEIRLEAVEDQLEAELALGRHRALVGSLEAIVGEHPLRERLRGQLMLALYRSGRQAEALECYQHGRSFLLEELGIDPGRPLRELQQAILRQDRGLDLVTVSEPASETQRSPFVGRTAELGELLTGLDDALAGRGRLFLLSGEPGIGKSRLAEELVAQARDRGARILVGRCWEAGGAPAYWPWMQSLRSYVRETESAALRLQLGAGAGELAHILPELRELLPGLPEPLSVESESARFRLFDATAEFLRNASSTQPLVLILDDLHAADAPSLLLLQFLARELGSARLLVLGTYRDLDPIPGHDLTAMLTEVTREPVARRLALGGLSENDVADYVELTASEIASPELVAALHEETEGNPLFIGEMVRLLALEGVDPKSAGAAIVIPQSVRDVIARRLAHLSEECNRVLVLASVLGREFAVGTLARVGSVSEDELLETLDEAMAARVVSDVPAGPGRLRFAHVLMRDTLYERLTTARRVRLHRTTVEALEALSGGEPGSHLAELAHHAIAGSDFDRGLLYARRAADRALALLAYEEAARLYETALEALDLSAPSDDRVRCELLLALGEARIRAGASPSAKQTFLDAAGLARRLGLTHELARAAAGYGGRIVWVRAGGDDRLVPLLEEGLAALADKDIELRTRLLARLAGALRDEHSRDRRDRLTTEALELARNAGNSAALAYALAGRAHAITAPDTIDECLALGTELRDVATLSGDRERVVAAHAIRFVAQLMVGDVRGAEADLAASSVIAQELGQPAQLWDVCAARALLALAGGRLAEADELVAQAWALGEHAVPEGALPIYHLQQYGLRDLRGGVEEVEPAIRTLVAGFPARPIFRCVLAHLHARLGRLPEARRELEHLAGGHFSALPFDQEWLYGMSLLSETAALVDDADSAAALYELLAPWGALNAVDVGEGFRGSISRYLGILSTTMSRWDDAARHFEDALEMNERMGARPWLALTQHDYGRMLLARNGLEDRRRAGEVLREALATYHELGLQGYAAGAESLLLDAEPATR